MTTKKITGWDKVEEAIKNEGSNSVDTPFIKFEPGKTKIIRVVSQEPISRWKHWMPQHKRSFICAGKGCPICAENDKARANGGKATYGNTNRHHLLVLDRDDKTVKILEQGNVFFGQLLTLRKEIGDLSSFDVKVVRTGKDKDTTYMLLPVFNTELTDEEKEAIASNTLNLDEFFSTPTKEQLVRILAGESVDAVFSNQDKIEEDNTVDDIEVDFTDTDEDTPF